MINMKVMYTSASQKDVYNWCEQRFPITIVVGDLVNQLPIIRYVYKCITKGCI